MPEVILWGATASPYHLKMQSMLDHSGHSWRSAPENVSLREAVLLTARLHAAKARGRVLRFGGMDTELDEYPAVPFYTLDGRTFYYDSTRLASHLDAFPGGSPPLLPDEPWLRFLAHLIDEAVDEFGLYMVHHNRWVISAGTNDMGTFTARQAKTPAWLTPLVARWLTRRQVRRCPYLFSVAPEGFDAGVDEASTPPRRPGFPPTHDLLNEAWRAYLAALETILSVQPFVLGERFTLADASIYGQFSMNLVDGRANEILRSRAPRTHGWLCNIRDGDHRGGRDALRASPLLSDLLSVIGETFIPLMQQNARAYDRAVAAGETLFNEAAFDRGRALYDGELMGHRFRHVVKTFQVSVWNDLQAEWKVLAREQRARVLETLPQSVVAAFTEGA